jgi:CheY-like chemotaxis protein
MTCLQCAQPVPLDARFCPRCGAKLAEVCPACGGLNAPDFRFCQRCGGALTGAGAAPEPTAAVPDSGGRPLVLVADDDEAIRELVRDVLAEAGFRTVMAVDGDEVLDLAVRHRPALVVLDVMMPKLDGYTTLTRLHGNVETREIPVVILTGQTGQQYPALSYGVGAAAHVTKPFSPRQLMDTVERVLGERSG